MYLRYYLNEKGERQYTLATLDPSGKPTLSAHPGEQIICYTCPNQASLLNVIHCCKCAESRFSPEDKYSRQRIIIKKRFGLLITQQPEPIH